MKDNSPELPQPKRGFASIDVERMKGVASKGGTTNIANWNGGLSAFLVPYTEFSPVDLARQFHNIVTSNHEELTTRNLLGVMARYGTDLETAQANVIKGRKDSQKIGHFAVINAEGSVAGSASIYPNLKLRQLRLPIAPFFAVGPLAIKYPYANPNVHAWVDKAADEALLSDVYNDLVSRTRRSRLPSGPPRPWTIEPTGSPQHIHEAIGLSGLKKITTARFDDEESRRSIPSYATLYAQSVMPIDVDSAMEIQNELRSGQTAAAA